MKQDKIPCGRLDTSLINKYYSDIVNYILIIIYLILVFSIGYVYPNDNYISVVLFLSLLIFLLSTKYYFVSNSSLLFEDELVKVLNKEQNAFIKLENINSIEVKEEDRIYARGKYSLIFKLKTNEELEIYFPSTFKGSGEKNLYKFLLLLSLNSKGNDLVKLILRDDLHQV